MRHFYSDNLKYLLVTIITIFAIIIIIIIISKLPSLLKLLFSLKKIIQKWPIITRHKTILIMAIL